MPPSADLIAPAKARVASLQETLQLIDGKQVRLVETHISWVLLTRDYAYKFKKPVKLPFLDFSTLAARNQACDEELRLNRRLAPWLYLEVVTVCEGQSGPTLQGEGTTVDFAVKMRRFDDTDLWSERIAAGALLASHVDQLAQRLADFHQDAAVAPMDSEFGTSATQVRITQGLIGAIDSWASGQGAAAGVSRGWHALRAWLQAELNTLAPLFESRRREGRVRECHGDLHLANLIVRGEDATAFDGIEFDPLLRWIDVLNDIAFCAMDLTAHGAPALAYRFINAYLEATGDYAGLPLLRFYLVCRALVRAQVAIISPQQGPQPSVAPGVERYLALAIRLSEQSDARLAITHGLPGSGKTYVSQGALEAVGAIRVRSDVERKRLFGLRPLQTSKGHVESGIYNPDSTARTYDRLLNVARLALLAKWPVIADAAFLRREERALFAGLADDLAVPFCIFDCCADSSTLVRRLAQRQASGSDASEADAQVLAQLRMVAQPLTPNEVQAALAVGEGASPATVGNEWICRTSRL